MVGAAACGADTGAAGGGAFGGSAGFGGAPFPAAAAADAGRAVEDDHFGLSLPVALDGVPESLLASIARRRPHADPELLIAT